MELKIKRIKVMKNYGKN